jgi:hypothetical protein
MAPPSWQLSRRGILRTALGAAVTAAGVGSLLELYGGAGPGEHVLAAHRSSNRQEEGSGAHTFSLKDRYVAIQALSILLPLEWLTVTWFEYLQESLAEQQRDAQAFTTLVTDVQPQLKAAPDAATNLLQLITTYKTLFSGALETTLNVYPVVPKEKSTLAATVKNLGGFWNIAMEATNAVIQNADAVSKEIGASKPSTSLSMLWFGLLGSAAAAAFVAEKWSIVVASLDQISVMGCTDPSSPAVATIKCRYVPDIIKHAPG